VIEKIAQRQLAYTPFLSLPIMSVKQPFLTLLRLVRIDQWVKNLFVFIPAFFAARLDEPMVLAVAVHAFLTFCLVASGVYILNDICDISYDQAHPTKCKRPIASGQVSLKQAWVLNCIFIATGLVSAWTINLFVFGACLSYVALNFAYSLRLKHLALLDVSLIALGFLLRVFAGAAATEVKVSHWLIVMTFLLALILGFAKRRAEYLLATKEGESTRRALEGYNLPFIDAAMVVSATVAVVAYLMYCFSPEVTLRIGSDRIYYTAFFVIMGLFRYLQLTYVYHRTESPTRALLMDRTLQGILLGWVGCFLWLLYLKGSAIF
jgi:decaprenyl-phosphate phosphoribosyltransferase